METNTLLVLIFAMLACGFAVVSYRLTAVTRAVILATAAAGEVLHRDVGHLEGKVTELLSEIGTTIQALTKDIHTVLLSADSIASDIREALRIAAGNGVQAVEVNEDLHSIRNLVELAESIDRSLLDLAAIPQDLNSIKTTLEIIADNTSDEIPDHGV
jgi:hypothetical protein